MHRCRLGMPAIGPHSRAEGKTEVTIGRQEVSGCVLAALAVGFLAIAAVHVAAQPAFFQGKQVRFYTMGSPGGGYDTYMRALIPHLEKKLGANPRKRPILLTLSFDGHDPNSDMSGRFCYDA